MTYVQGEFELPGEPTPSIVVCAFDGCDRPRSGKRRWCDRHYMRLYRNGTGDSAADYWAADGLCEVCGHPLPTHSQQGGKARKYCGPQCRNVAMRVLHYGITVRKFMTMYEEARGCCQICGRQLALFSGNDKGVVKRNSTIHIDHDHATGVVRGLLCSPCNSGIGMLDEDVDRLRRAIAYLESVRAPGDDASVHHG